LTSLFGTRRRLPISATAHACGHQTRALTILAGTDAVTPFLFLRVTPLPCGSGDPRRAAQRPLVSTPVPVPPGSHQVFPTAISTRARHLRELPRRSFSGDRRARVRGPREGRVVCRTREARFRVSRVRCMRFVECMRTWFPSSAPSGHPLSPVRRREGRRPVPDGGPNQDLRSDDDPRRTTPSRRPGCLPPLRSAVSVRVRIAPTPNLPRRSLAHATHTFSPGWGECLHGHCKHQSAVTRDPWHSRNKRLCYRGGDPFGSLVPGADDPSAPFGSDGVAGCES
jgi:hypothetical protein